MFEFCPIFLSFVTGTIKFWSLRQGVRIQNFEEKNKQNEKTIQKKNKQNLSAVFFIKWGVP